MKRYKKLLLAVTALMLLGIVFGCGKNETKEHTFGDSTQDRKTNLKTAVCKDCGKTATPLTAKENVNFEAYCKGDVSLTLLVSGGSAEVDFLVDGEVVLTKTYEPGEHTQTVTTGLEEGWYSFTLRLRNSAKVYVSDIQVDGKIARKDAVILELKKKDDSKGQYEDFFVYVKTSDPSGRYYVRYNFIYEFNDKVEGTVNSTDNINAFRIKQAYLVEITGITEEKVMYDSVMTVLYHGEIALAAKEDHPAAVDFVGGFHGDDNMTAFQLKADGIEYVPGEMNAVVICDSLEIFQEATINRCAQPDVPVMTHTQNYTIDAAGVKLDKSLTWLTDDFNSTMVYMQMFTLARAACEDLMVLNSAGENPYGDQGINVLEDTDVKIDSQPDLYADKKVLSSTENRHLIYSSDKTGISARIGFDIVDNSCSVREAFVQLRYKDAKDNKWYVNFTCADGSTTPKIGEVWKLNTYFDIDYVE